MALSGFTATQIQRQAFVHVFYALQVGGATGTGLGNPSSGVGLELPLNTGHGEMSMDNIMEAVMRGTWAGGGTLGGSILVNPIAGQLVRRYWTLEEYEADLLQSEVYSNIVWAMFSLGVKPNGMIAYDYDWVGTGQADGLDQTTSPAAPNFSTAALPSATAGVPVVPMAALDASVTMDDGSGARTIINL